MRTLTQQVTRTDSAVDTSLSKGSISQNNLRGFSLTWDEKKALILLWLSSLQFSKPLKQPYSGVEIISVEPKVSHDRQIKLFLTVAQQFASLMPLVVVPAPTKRLLTSSESNTVTRALPSTEEPVVSGPVIAADYEVNLPPGPSEIDIKIEPLSPYYYSSRLAGASSLFLIGLSMMAVGGISVAGTLGLGLPIAATLMAGGILSSGLGGSKLSSFWRHSSVKHRLFDRVSKPQAQYAVYESATQSCLDGVGVAQDIFTFDNLNPIV